MSLYILSLSDPKADLETAGGKGMSLTRMLNAGLSVPGGFHITTAAYREYVAANGLQAGIAAALAGAEGRDPAGLERASVEIARLFAAGTIPPELNAAVTGAYLAMQGQTEAVVAVRSSATAEDLPDASFAGQQETYLNIQGAEAVLEAVKKCWASLWTARAIAYRLKGGIDQAAVALAVVVQELVPANAAGILFTANPVNGSRAEVLINAAWGLGEAVVSGAVTPDVLTVDKARGKLLRRETAEKQVMTVRVGGGTREQAVPAALRKTPTLTPRQAAELTALGSRIEDFYGRPMDIEWALAKGKFYILQARPITALPPEWVRPDPACTYARGSLAEHTPGPVTPLFATFGLKIANQATEELWARILDVKILHLLAEGGFYAPINGYVYGGMRMNGKDMWTVLRMSIAQMKKIYSGSKQRFQAARASLSAVVELWEGRPLEALPAAELLAGARTVFLAACRYFTDIQTILPVASSSETLFSVFYNKLVRRKGDPESVVFLVGSETDVLRAEKSLYDLALVIQARPTLAEYIAQTSNETLSADLADDAPPARLAADSASWEVWRAGWNVHRRQFGRSAYEFDFAFPTALETPGPDLDALKGFLSGRIPNPYERQQTALERRESATRAIRSRLLWPLKGWFTRLLAWAQDVGPLREDSINDMGLGHPVLRRIFGELGRRLAAAGAIQKAEDIYWLEKNELEESIAALEGGMPLADWSARIPARQAQRAVWQKLTPPVMVPERSGWSKLIHGRDVQVKDGKTILKGVGTSSGTVTAPACVLSGPEDFAKLKPGDVLVAVTTTPAWTPLFALASAVVTDIGGPLSHSSIVAREYGIPAVMAARGATHAIRNGQVVTVDGAAGTIIF